MCIQYVDVMCIKKLHNHFLSIENDLGVNNNL
jgi:hypothetical protein